MPSWVWILLGVAAVIGLILLFTSGIVKLPSGTPAQGIGAPLNPTVATTSYGK